MLTIKAHLRRDDFVLDVDTTLPDGVIALVGPSGSGKTTLLDIIAGLVVPNDGRMSLDGVMVFDRATAFRVPPHRRRIGYVFQEPRLFPHLSVRGNLCYPHWVKGRLASPDSLNRVVTLLGLSSLLKRRPASLSGGERQRVAIGRALLAEPRLLLLDEPLSGLDPARRAEILPWLQRLRDELALPMVFVSHRLDEVAPLSPVILQMEAGRIVQSADA